MYTAGEPKDAVKVYLDWVMTSSEAQGIVGKLGFVPVR
jgi:ABC-type phosphate transport system substrate-binding protein